MKIRLIRHGETIWQSERRYQGSSDVPLSEEGKQKLFVADALPDRLYVSALKRASETAEILFPKVEQIPVEGLNEMRFGRFEGKNYIEMERDEDYRKWVESGCMGKCPEGESMDEFIERVSSAFLEIVRLAWKDQVEEIAIVAHGGTQMAVLSAFLEGEENTDYFKLAAGCGEGYLLEVSDPFSKRFLKLIGHCSYTR